MTGFQPISRHVEQPFLGLKTAEENKKSDWFANSKGQDWFTNSSGKKGQGCKKKKNYN